jgi:hypothetical protein
MKFCGECGTQTNGAACSACTSKSAAGLSFESLDKSLAVLENVSKGVRPAPAKENDTDKRTAKEVAEDAKELQKKYGQHGEGETEEQPKTKKGVEEVAKKGFPLPEQEEEEEQEFAPRRRSRPEEEEEEEEAREPEFKSASKKKKTKKSFADTLAENSEAVSKAIDISDYLRDFVYAVSESTDGLSARVEKSLARQAGQGEFNVALAKAMQQVGILLKGLTEKVESFGTTPAGQRKSDVSVVEKSFGGKEGTELKKSDIAAKLTTLMESGNKSVTVADVLSADASGFVRPELRELVGLPVA